MANATPFIELQHVSKVFGNVRALHDVSFAVYQGEVVGLVGDNGAGKSTLIKILSGFYQPDEGRLLLEGRPVRFPSPQAARTVGIETVYQDLALVEELSIWRNFYLGKEITFGLGPMRMLAKRRMKRETQRGLADMGIRLRSPNEPVAVLSGGERQAVAIARTVHFGARLIILDEPTAALSVKETNKVLESVMAARGRGLGVVFITHNLHQAYQVSDRLVMLERGHVAGVFRKNETTVERITEAIARA
jgi:simple sugar transport system ATP-binding protein